METACDGCRKHGKHNHDERGDGRPHTCKCKSRSDQIKIDGGLEQTAASTDEADTAARGTGPADNNG